MSGANFTVLPDFGEYFSGRDPEVDLLVAVEEVEPLLEAQGRSATSGFGAPDGGASSRRSAEGVPSADPLILRPSGPTGT